MESIENEDNLQEFYAWMDLLNEEAVRSGCWDLPLCDTIAHSPNCWIEDFRRGLTPAEALEADGRP